jgi:hypothetical protein
MRNFAVGAKSPASRPERNRLTTVQILHRTLLGYFLISVFFRIPEMADDALVLPRHAWRFYLIPIWTTVHANFDANGERQPIPVGAGRIESFNLGYAIEYGINNWLTTGFQWSPGTTLSSAFDFPPGDPQRRDKARLNDAFDAKIGFKLQMIGAPSKDPKRATGLFQSDTLRLAVAFGVKLPLIAIDWDREATDFLHGNSYLAQAADRHLAAPIVSLHVDYVFLKDRQSEFFVNFYSQYVPYLSTGRYRMTSLARYLNLALADSQIDYGYDLLVEIDPRLEKWIVPRALRIGCYLPVRYKTAPATRLDGVEQHDISYGVTVFPTLDLFWMLPRFPIEIKIGYQYNFAGKNSPQAHTLAIILRVIVL